MSYSTAAAEQIARERPRARDKPVSVPENTGSARAVPGREPAALGPRDRPLFRAAQFVITGEQLGSPDRVVLNAQVRRRGFSPLPFPDPRAHFARLDHVLEWAAANGCTEFLPTFGVTHGARGDD